MVLDTTGIDSRGKLVFGKPVTNEQVFAPDALKTSSNMLFSRMKCRDAVEINFKPRLWA